MKRILTTAIIATLLSAVNISAQNVKATTYVIDGQTVESFDGSQLTGKTIVSYTVNNNVHVVFTSDYKGKASANTRPSNGTVGSANVDIISVNGNTVVYVIDGKVTSLDTFKSMSTSGIESVRVIKSKDDPDFKKYARPSTNIVMMITTKY